MYDTYHNYLSRLAGSGLKSSSLSLPASWSDMRKVGPVSYPSNKVYSSNLHKNAGLSPHSDSGIPPNKVKGADVSPSEKAKLARKPTGLAYKFGNEEGVD